MFRAWFGPRTARLPERNRFFRPRLEYLEGRLAPSSMGMSADGNGDGDGNGNGNGDGNGGGNDNNGNEPPGQERFINNYDNYNTNDDNSFQIVFNNITINNYFTVASIPTAQLDQMFISNIIQAVETTPGATLQDAFSLASSEYQLGQDTGMLAIGILNGASNQTQQNLVQEIHNLQNSIQNNVLEGSAAGQVAGVVAFDVGLQASLSHFPGGPMQGGGQMQGHG